MNTARLDWLSDVREVRHP